MTYHLARVMHWIQNGNVEHYATHIERQVSQPPLSEYVQMQFILLGGADRFANLVQWIFMTGTLAVIFQLGYLLSGNKNIALLSALLAVCVPMGILQSSSTQNDYAVTFFIAGAMLFAYQSYFSKFSALYIIGFSLSVALACLTKGTAYIFLIPVVVFYSVCAIVQLRMQIWKPLLAGIIIFIAINGVFFMRNVQTFQHPLAPDPTLQNAFIGLQPIASNTAKNAAMHFLTPFAEVNKIITTIVEKYHAVIGTDINDPRFNWQFSPQFSTANLYPHEDYATAPMHILFLFLACLWVLFTLRKNKWYVVSYVSVIIVMWLMFSMLLKWQVWHCRLHLPMLIISCPVLAIYIFRLPKLLYRTAIFLFVLVAIPALVYNYSRPLFGSESVFTNSMYDQYFFNQPESKKPFFDMSAVIQRNNMHSVGWAITGDTWEYPMWVLLQDTYRLRMEHIMVNNKTAMYEDSTFVPDGIINTILQPDSVNRIYFHGNAYQTVYENDTWKFMQKVEQ